MNNGWLVFWSRTMPISVKKQFVQDWTHLLTTSWLVAHCRKNLNKQTCSGRQTLRGHQWYVGRFGFTHPIATRSVGVWAPDFANPFMFGSKYMSYKHCRYLHHMKVSFREVYLICFLAKSQFWLASQFFCWWNPAFLLRLLCKSPTCSDPREIPVKSNLKTMINRTWNLFYFFWGGRYDTWWLIPISKWASSPQL